MTYPMKWKIISYLLCTCSKPATNSSYLPLVVRQTALRWDLLLKERKFMLPDFSELRITFVEQPSVTETKLELHWLPIVGWFRDVNYYVPSLPD